MRYVAYTLTMPRNNAWNNQWSGDSKLYCRVQKVREHFFPTSPVKNLIGKSFRYDFSDGWEACIDVSEVSEKEATNLVKRSSGFCGYEWMIASLLEHSKITTANTTYSPIFMR